jgi:hypothetical protein
MKPIPEEFAKPLFAAMLALDEIWGRGAVPEPVGLITQTVTYALLKTLQHGGWDVYFDAELNRRELRLRSAAA